MMKFKQITQTSGDCTAGYSVSLNKSYTVKELIEEILTGKDWGSIRIINGGICEYEGSSLISELP